MADAAAEYDHVALHRMERGGCGEAAFYLKGASLKGASHKGDPADAARASAKDGSPIEAKSPVVCTTCGEGVGWGSLSLEVKPRG
jgi:hypothetical protein